DSDGWSIVANFRAPTAGTRRPNDAQSPGNLMLQSLLEDRFQLRFHRETRDMPIYALTVAKGGPKIKLSEDQTVVGPPDRDAPPPRPPQPGDPMQRGGILARPGTLEARAVPMARIIQVVFRQLDRIVV